MDWQTPKDAVEAIRRTEWDDDTVLGNRLCGEGARRFPDSPELLAAYARVLTTLGRKEERDSVLKRALSLGPECATAWAAEASIDAFEARREEALEAARKAVALDDTDPWVLRWCSDALSVSGKPNRARELTQRWRELYSDDVTAWAGSFNALYATGRVAEAMRLLEQAEQKFPETPLLWRLRATVLQRTNLSHAIELFRRATEGAPGSSEAWAGYAGALCFAGRYVEAEEAAAKALEICPVQADVMQTMERICIRCGRRSEARRWQKSVESIPFMAEGSALEPAAEALRTRKWIRAMTLVVPALSSPVPIFRTEAIMFRTQALLELENLDEAENWFSELDKSGAEGPDLYVLKGRLLDARGNLDGAIEAFREGLAKYPCSGILRYYLITLLKVRRAHHQVEQLAADTFDHIPKTPWGLQWAARGLSQSGFRSEANKLLDIGRSEFPDIREFLLLKALNCLNGLDFVGLWATIKDWWTSRRNR